MTGGFFSEAVSGHGPLGMLLFTPAGFDYDDEVVETRRETRGEYKATSLVRTA